MTRLASSKYWYMACASTVQAALMASAATYRRQRIGGALSAARAARARASRFAAGSVAAIVMTSKLLARRASSVAVEGLSNAASPWRLGAPTSTRVARRVVAYSSRASTADGPSRVTVSAPSDSPSFSNATRRSRSPLGQAPQRWSLDVHHGPLGVQRVRESFSGADHLLGLRVRPGGDQHAIARQPAAYLTLATECGARRCGFGTIGHAPQRQLAQRQQVAAAEEPVGGGARVLGHVDLACLESRQEVVGRQIDQLDFIGLVEDAVREGLALPHSRDLRHQVVEALEMLHIDRGPDIDAGLQQFLDVLPALGVTRRRIARGNVRMRQLIDNQDRGPAPQRCVEVELLTHDATVPDGQRRQLLDAFLEALGLDAAVWFDVSEHQVRAHGTRTAGGFQHRVSLADARGRSEKNAQPPAPRPGLLGRDMFEQLIGIGPRIGHEASVDLGSCRVEREIQLQHIHAWLT